ncbi:MAG: hypothetical protein WCB27_08685 [Thermoguttaceae bacterium]
MEAPPTRPKPFYTRARLLTVFVCTLVVLSFMHMAIVGATTRSNTYQDLKHTILHGWPAPFAEHRSGWNFFADGAVNPPSFSERVDPTKWTSFHISSVTNLICDGLLSLLLTTATGVVILRLQKRSWTRWQFSIADMFSLITTTSMVLGLIFLDSRLSIGGDPAAEDIYLRLRDLPLFDRVMVLFAIACAVWLIVSTVSARLGKRTESQD